ncbi:MAG: tetratricopeptide repeat protein [Gemmataceae bacterium]
MKRTLIHCFVGMTLIAPCAGCFSIFNESLLPDSPTQMLQKPLTTGDSLPSKKSGEICLTLAIDLEKQGHLEEAAVEYDRARSFDSKSAKVAARRLGVIYDQAGNERKALAEFDEALKMSPKDPDLLNDVGYCHYNRGRWSKAESYFRQALAISPHHERANINLGLALAQQDKFDESMQAFAKVNTPAQAKANVAFVLASKGKREEAMQAYRDALRAEPGLVAAQQALVALENGGKVNLPKLVPNNPQETTAAKPQVPSCAAGSCPTSEPAPDMSPVSIGPRR